jgi:hypothetical protein
MIKYFIKTSLVLLVFTSPSFSQNKLKWYQGLSQELVKPSRIELGYGTGVEVNLIGIHADLSADFYLTQGIKNRLSIHNKSGVGALAHLALYPYTYPAIKYQHGFSKSWLVLSAGYEIAYFHPFNDDDRYWTTSLRMDLGYKIYKKSNKAIEFYVPIRAKRAEILYPVGLLIMFSYGL